MQSVLSALDVLDHKCQRGDKVYGEDEAVFLLREGHAQSTSPSDERTCAEIRYDASSIEQ